MVSIFSNKGVTVTEDSYIAVVGGVNVDICGRAFAPLIARDSNPGTVRLSLGGVGRNIAHNLCLLGQRVTMLTAIGTDIYADKIEESCAAIGIDLSHACRIEGGVTSTYLFLTGPDGDMELAVCDAALSANITPSYLEQKLSVLNGASAVVFETNLTGEAIEYLAQHCTAPLFADPVSVTKAEKLRLILNKLHTLKPNILEAELYTGVKITDQKSLEQAAERLLATGLRRAVISLGSRGVCVAEQGGKLCYIPCPPTALINATGGGDAMMAGITAAFVSGLSQQQTAAFGVACGSIAVEGSETINPALSIQTVNQKMQTIL